MRSVKGHFDADAARFDAIYDDAKGPFDRFMDDVWRGVVRRRFELGLFVWIEQQDIPSCHRVSCQESFRSRKAFAHGLGGANWR